MLLWPLSCLFAINMSVGIAMGRSGVLLAFFAFLSLHYFVPAETTQQFYGKSNTFILLISGAIIVYAMTAVSLSVSQRRKQLQRLANRDHLTDLYNRRFFISFIHHQMSVALREKKSFTLALADIDHFKTINDTYGHDVGDKVLQAVADCFKRYLAQHDVACRWGGEEFLIYLPENDVSSATPVIEAIAAVIRDIGIENLTVTMSFGLVESDGSEALDTLLQRADALMYQAKSLGRDNIQTTLL